jgi:hypothetical protein
MLPGPLVHRLWRYPAGRRGYSDRWPFCASPLGIPCRATRVFRPLALLCIAFGDTLPGDAGIQTAGPFVLGLWRYPAGRRGYSYRWPSRASPLAIPCRATRVFRPLALLCIAFGDTLPGDAGIQTAGPFVLGLWRYPAGRRGYSDRWPCCAWPLAIPCRATRVFIPLALSCIAFGDTLPGDARRLWRRAGS